jgi:hypothetical protein
MPKKSSISPPKLNAKWHGAHRMPKNPTFEQRVAWHADHMAHCACRKPTGTVLEALRQRGIAVK